MRSMWRGTIRFSLVSIPVKIYSAIETSEKIQFNQLHRDDFGAIGYDKRCKKCNEVVTNDQITKGYQYEPDRYAIVEPDDLAKIKIKTTKAVDIVGFVAREEIPTTFYDAPYFAGPDGPISENPYALLREVMKQTGKIAVGKVELRQMLTAERSSGGHASNEPSSVPDQSCARTLAPISPPAAMKGKLSGCVVNLERARRQTGTYEPRAGRIEFPQSSVARQQNARCAGSCQ